MTIPNVVDLSEFRYDLGRKEDAADPSSEDPADNGITRFISAASINYGKGFDILIRAYAEVIQTRPDIHLTIMGDGPELNAIRSLAAELKLDEGDSAGMVTFTGPFVRSEFAEALNHSDVFVLASRSETFGIVYAEALAAGVPVIATKCGGPEDFIDETNGILIPVEDVEALATAMHTMIVTCDRYEGASLASVCRSHFSPESVAQQIKTCLSAIDTKRNLGKQSDMGSK